MAIFRTKQSTDSTTSNTVEKPTPTNVIFHQLSLLRPRTPQICTRRTVLRENICYKRSQNRLIFCCTAHQLLIAKQLAKLLCSTNDQTKTEEYIRSLRRLNLISLVLIHTNSTTNNHARRYIRRLEMQEEADTDTGDS